MKALRLLFVVAVLLSISACSATVATPTPTVAIIPLPNNAAPSVSNSAIARTAAAVTPRATTPASATPSATPTRVLKVPLEVILPQPTATPTVVPLAAPPVVVAPLPSGRLVMQLASGGDIVVVNADGSSLTRLTTGLDPAWSPDGRQIAFTRWSEPQGIYVMNADGSNLRMVYQINGAKSPTWSPDGSKIAFTWKYRSVQRTDRHGNPIGVPNDFWRISVVDVATGNKTDVPMDPDQKAFTPDWGPDGRLVYKGMRGLWITDLAGPPVKLTDNPLDESPAWSPDGQRIVFMSKLQDHRDVLVINADGSGRVQLTASPPDISKKPVNNVSPLWTPDGKSIAFLTDRDSDWHVYIMNIDGSNQRRLLDVSVAYDFAAERVFDWTK